MPPPFQKHVFVCTNQRPDDDPRGSCAGSGGEAVRDALKKKLKDRGLSHDIRANNAGCLDNCAAGVTMVVYPEGVWYQKVTVADVDAIIDEHLVGGKVVERLVWRAPAQKKR